MRAVLWPGKLSAVTESTTRARKNVSGWARTGNIMSRRDCFAPSGKLGTPGLLGPNSSRGDC